MKKMVWVVLGIVVVVGVVLISHPEKSGKPDGLERTQGTQKLTTEHRKSTEEKSGGMPSSASVVNSDVDSAEAELSAPVKSLLGLDDKKHNYPSLLSAINDLGDEMSADDVAALMEMLNFPNDRFPEKMRPIEINAVKNDALDKLLRQKQLPEGLGLHMVEMAGNADNDPVWRDYCIQFMTPFYERMSKEAGDWVREKPGDSASVDSWDAVPPSELSAVRDAMCTALDERTETLAGTALIGLELLSRTHNEFDRELIVNKATEIASDEMASAASRMTALRLSAGLTTEGFRSANYEGTVQAARSLAQTGETVLLRSSAIVTLGEIGTDGDRELLVSYATDENRQIAEAAKLALEKMDQEPSVKPAVVSKTTSEPQITEKFPPVLIN